MFKLYRRLYDLLLQKTDVCLATIISKKGSGPQVPGSSALFDLHGLIHGTLGGGIIEAYARNYAFESLQEKKAQWIEFDLNNDISEKEAAICGGKTGILLDPEPEENIAAFNNLNKSLSNGIPGVLISCIERQENGKIQIHRHFRNLNDETPLPSPFDHIEEEIITHCAEKRTPCLIENPVKNSSGSAYDFFLEPAFPLPELLIAGAGHIGKALCHLASLLDFHVTVIDDRPEYANQDNLPDADKIIIADPSETINNFSVNRNSYIVILTRGHAGDAEVLRSCMDKPAAYIGMIGSRRKIELMRKHFLSQGWTNEAGWNKIHAPVGIDIGSKTVQEIAISIAAELITVINNHNPPDKSKEVYGIILAAGESRRMGMPKMLLPFKESTIIETVIQQAAASEINDLWVILGAEKELVREKIIKYNVHISINDNHREGMLSSVICGIHAVPRNAGAVIIFLGDQPMIRSELIDQLILEWKNSGKGIVVPVFKGKRGHPLLIDMKYKPNIESIDKETGLRALLADYPEDLHEFETNENYILNDIDTPADYEKLSGFDIRSSTESISLSTAEKQISKRLKRIK